MICFGQFELHIGGNNFKNNTISSGWYQAKRPIHTLIINDHKVRHIEAGAFNTNQFHNLKVLHIAQTNITKIHEDMFNGLISLEVLSIVYSRIQLIESNAFRQLVAMKSFLLLKCDAHVIKMDSAFNGAQNLQTISLHYSNFATTVTKDMFLGTRIVVYLILNYNRIEAIDKDAFDYVAKTLRLLSLRGNLLKTLPENIFKFLSFPGAHINEIDLSQNQWDCNCSMLHIQKLVRKFPITFKYKIFCENPKSTLPIEKITFCSQNNSFTHITADSYKLMCRKSVMNYYAFVTAILLKPKETVHVKNVADGKMQLDVKLLPSRRKIILFEHIVTKSTVVLGAVQCLLYRTKHIYGAQEILLKDGLQSGNSYTVCIMDYASLSVNPLNCASATKYRKKKNSDEKVSVVTAVLLIFIISMSFGTLLAFYLID